MKFFLQLVRLSFVLGIAASMIFLTVAALLLFAPEAIRSILVYSAIAVMAFMGIYFFISSVAGLSINFLLSVKRDP